jgi:uncharacterized protein YwgA
MFLLSQRGKEFVGHDFYKFQPYLYGPYSPQLATDLDALSKSGNGPLIANYAPGSRRLEYLLALDGFRIATEVRSVVDTRALKFVEDTVAWVKAQTFSGLLASIYKSYPEFATQSVFKT